MSSEFSTPDGSKPSARRPDLPETLLVASVRRPHGVHGDLLFEVHSDVDGRLERGSRLDLVTGSGARRSVQILRSRSHALGVILTLEGVATRAAAEALRGSVLEIERTAAPPAPEGQYYFHELVGCRCVDRREGVLGVVVEIVEDGGGLLLGVEDERRRLLLPFVERYLERVDTASGVIELRLPEGLVETCASTR